MAADSTYVLDVADRAVLDVLADNARASIAEIARTVGLAPSTVAERVRRLEHRGVIRGYRLDVDLTKLGYALTALVRLTGQNVNNHALLGKVVDRVPEVLQCHRVTGQEGWVLTVVARDVAHLEQVIETLSGYGLPATSIVLSSWTATHLPPTD
ncbi:MAG TPA: Lrp/AsnC family transcriptional regulator [Propionibacteriaceae bacterium]